MSDLKLKTSDQTIKTAGVKHQPEAEDRKKFFLFEALISYRIWRNLKALNNLEDLHRFTKASFLLSRLLISKIAAAS